MPLNERDTRKQLIDPQLASAGWEIELELRIGPGRVDFSGDSADSMYDLTQAIIADYLLRYRGVPLAVLEAKAESSSTDSGVQQGSRYANCLMVRFSIACNSHDWILTDNETGDYKTLSGPPTPEDLRARIGTFILQKPLNQQPVSIDWERWEGAFTASFHVDQVTRK